MVNRQHLRLTVALAALVTLAGVLGSGCVSDGYSSAGVHYGIGMRTWWPHDYYWDRRPIYVGPPVRPDFPEPELPIEPPPEFIAVPHFD